MVRNGLKYIGYINASLHLVISSCLQPCTMYYNLTSDSCCYDDYTDGNESNDIEKVVFSILNS